jgi:hypothetical protein
MLSALVVALVAEFKVVSLFHALLQELHVFPNIAHEQNSPVLGKKSVNSTRSLSLLS